MRPARTPEGDAFTELVLAVVGLGARLTAIGEALGRSGGQTLARWVILDAIEDGPATVAQIARRRGIARQAVQRVADLLVEDGLAAYEPNPAHRRAKILRPTEPGREALRAISVAQKTWADAVGAELGPATLAKATTLVNAIRQTVAAHEGPSRPPRARRAGARRPGPAA